jgi:hypothetical protein
MANEHQQTRISAVGLATELNELREALSKVPNSARWNRIKKSYRMVPPSDVNVGLLTPLTSII